MARSAEQDVDGYLAELPDDRRAALARLRRLCRSELVGFSEVIAYGMPAYQRDGTTEVAFASQKRYLSFYLMRTDVREAFTERLAQQDTGKGCLRFRDPNRVDFTLLQDLLRATAAVPGPVC